MEIKLSETQLKLVNEVLSERGYFESETAKLNKKLDSFVALILEGHGKEPVPGMAFKDGSIIIPEPEVVEEKQA